MRLIWTSISSLDGNLVNLALSSLNMTCLVLNHCGVDLTLLSFLDACLVYTYWMGWCECGLGRHFFYTSTPFGQNRMNLVSQELVLFRFALKSLIVKELKCSVQKVSSLKSNTLGCWHHDTYLCLTTLLVYKSSEVTIMIHYWCYILRLLAFQVCGIGVPLRY